LWTITAFALAHSIALSPATLGVVDVSGPPVAMSCDALCPVMALSRNGSEVLACPLSKVRQTNLPRTDQTALPKIG